MKRILIVDSDMAVRGQIGRHARLEGYEVAEAGDGLHRGFHVPPKCV